MIQMVLKGLRQIEVLDQPALEPDPGGSNIVVDVLACAICRTDAKMWEQGHRDLVFPRVPGHEMAVQDANGKRYIVWPGKSCGDCQYCRSGKENLCDDMRITGFHEDGGFASKALIPAESLIPIPDHLDAGIACFAEPLGCVINAFDKLPLETGKRLLIYGGGTMGLITALYANHLGLKALILEKDEAKLKKIMPILEAEQLECVKETHESLFDLVINACPDYIAFCQAIAKVDKGGHISFFSGITKNETLETNLVNLIHYKEASISGAYGMKKSDMERAIPFLLSHGPSLTRLIEKTVSPEKAPDLLSRVLAGRSLKYILDFTGQTESDMPQFQPAQPSTPMAKESTRKKAYGSSLSKSALCMEILAAISPPDKTIASIARAKMDDKSKPLGALGKLEPLAVKMCRVLGTLTPKIEKKALLVFAGDHGITEEGVSAFPKEVTGQMVDNFLNGGAAINVLCRHHNIEMKVVDMGVEKEFLAHPNLIRAKVAPGTRNMAIEPAMTSDQVIQAVENGMKAFLSFSDSPPNQSPVQIIGLGEMGIGNTTSASAIISAITGITPAQATGRGTGVDDKGLSHKTEVIERVLNFHQPDPKNGLEILRTIGGFELAGIAGATLAAASKGCAVVLDGVISTAAGLVAYLINPDIQGYLIAGHQSVEKAQAAALAHMGLEPVVDLSMRLGEGTGAALAIDLTETACKLMSEMASFDEAKISRSPST